MTDGSTTDGHSKDVVLGKKALALGWITQEQLRDALAERFRESPDTKTLPPLRNVLLSRGYLSQEQIDRLLREGDAPEAVTLPAFPSPALNPGASFGKYQVVREVGRGGMGIVFEAVDQILNRSVALKIINDTSTAHPELRGREDKLFLKEARLAASLPPHPHVVAVHEADVIESKRYLTMELVQGKPMNVWREMGVTLRGQIELLVKIARAVQHAHTNGVLHCDLKPRNVLVDAKNHPHITDFGLAKSLRPKKDASAPSSEKMILGTPTYMSPEQIEGSKTLDARSDVYSLGVMLYELLTNRVPFEGTKPLETAFKVLYEPIVTPSAVAGAKGHSAPDPELERICLKALSKKPQDRQPTSEAFAEELARWLEGAPAAAVPAPPSDPPKRAAWIVPVAVAVAALIAVIVAMAVPKGTHPPAPVPPTPPAAERRVNLLPLIDPAQDVVTGKWTLKDGTLETDLSLVGKIEIPYIAPEEYDLVFVFERREGSGDVNAILSRDGHTFVWLMAGWGNAVCGFETIDGKRADHNPTTVRRTPCLENGKTYQCVVSVRRDRVEASLDGALVASWKTDYRDLSTSQEWAIRDSRHLGLATYNSIVAFRRIELVERTGRGRPDRGN